MITDETPNKRRWIYIGQGKLHTLSKVKETLKHLPTNLAIFITLQTRLPQGYTKNKILESIKTKKTNKIQNQHQIVVDIVYSPIIMIV